MQGDKASINLLIILVRKRYLIRFKWIQSSVSTWV